MEPNVKTPCELIAQWRTQADGYMRSAKSYRCRSQDGTRQGLVKAAATLRECARELEAAIRADDESAKGQDRRTELPDKPESMSSVAYQIWSSDPKTWKAPK